MKTTIYGIAKECRVSIATVSRALSPATRALVAAGTLRRIEEAARRAGYTPNLAARQLGASAYRTIGVALPHLRGILFSDYYRRVVAGAADALLGTGYRLKTVLLPEAGPRRWDRYDFRSGEGVDGLVLAHWPHFFTSPKVVASIGIPCVVMNDPEQGMRAHLAYGDNRLGGRLAARHLLAKGHRRIAVITGPRWSSDSRQRVAGFLEALAASGVRAVAVRDGDFQEEGGRRAVERLLADKKRFTALFCCNDLMACGALAAFSAAGVRCPGQVSVVGYDDDERARTSVPALTSVRVPVYELALESTAKLVEHLVSGGKDAFSSESTVHAPELIERASVGAARPAR